MIAQPEVVIRTKINHLAAADADGRVLRCLDVPLLLVQPALFQVFQLRAQNLAQSGVAHRDISVKNLEFASPHPEFAKPHPGLYSCSSSGLKDPSWSRFG